MSLERRPVTPDPSPSYESTHLPQPPCVHYVL